MSVYGVFKIEGHRDVNPKKIQSSDVKMLRFISSEIDTLLTKNELLQIMKVYKVAVDRIIKENDIQ